MAVDPGPHQIARTFVYLSAGGGAAPLQVDESFWGDLSAGRFGTGGWLVSQYEFAGRWGHWEMHPNGEELVYLSDGAVDFVLELAEGEKTIELREPGSYVLVPRGVWHIADAISPSSMFFITCEDGTEHRPV